MLPAMRVRAPQRALPLLLGALLAGAFLTVAPANAQDVRTDSGLALVPADAAFYTAMLRNKEQIDAVLKSKAYKKFQELQGVKTGLEQLRAELKKEGGPYAQFQKLLEDKENQELVEVLKDAASSEIFVYGGAAWNDLITALLKANNTRTLAPAEALLSGNDPNKAQVRALLESLQKNREQLRVPDLVIGFKVSDPKKSEAQLKRLEKLAEAMLPMVPPLKGRFKRDAQGALVLNLDGGLIPWEDANIKEYEDKEGEFKPLITHLKGMKLTVSVGVKKGYLLVGVTPTSAEVNKLVEKGKKLGDSPDLKALAKHAKKPVTSVGYVSKAFREAALVGSDLSDTTAGLKRLLEKADLPAARKKAIEKDMDALMDEMKKWRPELGASFSVEYLTEDGYEGYAYDLTKQERLKGVKLGLLDHFGGKPILAVGTAFPVTGEGYQHFVKWIKTVYGHLEGVLLEKVPDDNAKDEYKKFTKNFFPLVQKINETTAKLFLPSMKGNGGFGFVVDAQWKSKQWLKAAPESPQALPMLELGFLLGLSDHAKFEKALEEYRLTLNEMYEKVREASRDNVPEFKIPVAETTKVKGGTLYFYPIPEDAGVDKQFTPTLGVGEKAAAFALSKGHAQRLIGSTPLPAKGPLAEKRDVVAVCYFDFHALLDAAEPWVDYVAQNAAKEIEDKEGKKKAGEVAKEVKASFEILRVFHGYTSATHVEGGVLVTHSVTIIRDR